MRKYVRNYRLISDEDIIAEAKMVLAANEYFGPFKRKKLDIVKLLELIDNLTERLEQAKCRRHYSYTDYIGGSIYAVEERLTEKINENWSELKDQLDGLTEIVTDLQDKVKEETDDE